MISRTSDGSVRPGVSCDTTSVDTSSGKEQLLGQPLDLGKRCIAELSTQTVSSFRSLKIGTTTQRTLCSCPVARSRRVEGTREVVLCQPLGSALPSSDEVSCDRAVSYQSLLQRSRSAYILTCGFILYFYPEECCSRRRSDTTASDRIEVWGHNHYWSTVLSGQASEAISQSPISVH